MRASQAIITNSRLGSGKQIIQTPTSRQVPCITIVSQNNKISLNIGTTTDCQMILQDRKMKMRRHPRTQVHWAR